MLLAEIVENIETNPKKFALKLQQELVDNGVDCEILTIKPATIKIINAEIHGQAIFFQLTINERCPRHIMIHYNTNKKDLTPYGLYVATSPSLSADSYIYDNLSVANVNEHLISRLT
jgi:hypothetical protein